MERIWFVKQVPIFERLTPSEIRPLEYRSRARSFPKGAPIQVPAEPVVLLITEGGLSTEVAYGDDQSAVTVTLEPGDVLGILPGCAGVLHGESMVAHSETTMVAIPYDLFRGLVDRHSDLFIAVNKRMGWSTRRIVSWVSDLMFRTTRQRIARLLLRLVNSCEFKPAHETSIPIPLTTRDLTRLTASDLAVVEYVLGALVTDDLIRFRGNWMTLLDPRRLAHLHLQWPGPATSRFARKRVLQ